MARQLEFAKQKQGLSNRAGRDMDYFSAPETSDEAMNVSMSTDVYSWGMTAIQVSSAPNSIINLR